jgi:transposase
MMPGGLRIMLCATPMDMRASFDGLAQAVQERLAVDAKTEKAMYVFINKRRDMVKMLWRDATGWCLLAKRLERRLIELPKAFAAGQTSHLIDGKTLSTLMDGVEIRRQTRRDVAHEARAAVERRIMLAPPQPSA